MSPHLFLQLTVHLIITVTASLPDPHAKMIAEEANYMLHWYCNYTQLEYPVTFTAEYTLWNEQDDESLYTRVCEGSSECLCNFTVLYKEPFSLWFAIRVRAEAGLQHSNWTIVRFIPDQDVVLMPPRVNVMADKDVLTLTISESVLSKKMDLKYTVQYWERHNPEQKHTVEYSSPHVPLSSLKSCTEYCVRVRVFSPLDIHSNYSSPQCRRTTGCCFEWLVVLAVLPLLGLFICYKFRRRSPVYTAPASILMFTSVPSLLEVQEECWTIAQVTLPATEPTHTREEQEQEAAAQLIAPQSTCQCSGFSVHDSGFSSGLES